MSSRRLVSFRLADDLKQALDERADHEGISTTELVNRLLRQGLCAQQPTMHNDDRLANLEGTVRQILTMVEFERRMRETFSQPNQVLSEQLAALEKRVTLMSKVVFESGLDVERLEDADQQSAEDTQVARKEPVSLDEIKRLIESGN